MPLRAEDALKAKRQVVEGRLTLWNTRLEALMEAGRIDDALEQLRAPLTAEDINNCGCNVQWSCVRN